MDNQILILILVIPILTLLIAVLGYKYYYELNKKNRIVNLLKSDNNEILDEKKQKRFSKKDRNWLGKKLAYAGFPHASAEYIFIVVSVVFGFLCGTFINFVITNPMVFVLSSIAFSFFPLLILKKLIDGRLEEFNFGLKIIIDKVTSMMKSGVGFEQSLKKAVATSRSKLTKEIFEIYLNEKDIIGEDKAFQKMFTVVESKELRIFYLTISIGKQSGGKFSNTLDKLRKALHAQGEIKQEITASTKEIKVGSYMIIGLVIFIYKMLNASLGGVLDEHFFDTDEGQIQMFFIICWVTFGVFVNSMLSKVKA